MSVRLPLRVGDAGRSGEHGRAMNIRKHSAEAYSRQIQWTMGGEKILISTIPKAMALFAGTAQIQCQGETLPNANRQERSESKELKQKLEVTGKRRSGMIIQASAGNYTQEGYRIKCDVPSLTTACTYYSPSVFLMRLSDLRTLCAHSLRCC